MAKTTSTAASMQSEGSLTEALGKLTGDKDTEAKGAAQKKQGEADTAHPQQEIRLAAGHGSGGEGHAGTVMTDRQADKALALHEELLQVSRRRIEGDTVRVRTVTTSAEQHVSEPLRHTRVEVLRVPVGRVVERVPDIREEDGITIVPVVKEEIVITRRLVLTEEVHLRRVVVDDVHTETVVLHRQDAIVSRIPATAPVPGTAQETLSVQGSTE